MVVRCFVTQRVSSAHRPARAPGLALLFAVVLVSSAGAQPATGTIQGTVTFQINGEPVHGATVLVLGPGDTAVTGEDGAFVIEGIAAGTYEVIALREHLTGNREQVTVVAGEIAEARLELLISPIHEEVTVTANPTGASTTFDAFNSVITLDSFELSKSAASSVAEALEDEPGISTRSFGAGSTRPIIRGFDGDRVLITEDGVRTGDLSSQSGDHGVTIDPQNLERLEVVRGPATLLYGSNAVGGVVNAITVQDSFVTSPLNGTRGQLTTDFGSANAQAGLNGSLQFGTGSWVLWGGGGGRRTDDYDTPAGTVENSRTRLSNGSGGFGYFGGRGFASLSYRIEESNYGVPFAGLFHGEHEEGHEEEDEVGADEDHADIELDARRQAGRVKFGLRNLGSAIVRNVRATVNFSDWQHQEIEEEGGERSVGTTFDNQIWVLKGEVDQQRAGRLSGTFGVWAQTRDYDAVGAEALAPRTSQRAFAAFAYEELDFGRARLQFGGRVEHNDYDPDPRAITEDHAEAVLGAGDSEPEPPAVRTRDFTGFSGSAGVHVDLTDTLGLVTNLSRSSRAPALEELYNFGPHIGNLAFEIGNPDLVTERTTGLDISLRARSPRARGEVNFFYYGISDFVFQNFTGEVADGLRVADYLQADGRFTGFDGSAAFGLRQEMWLRLGLGFTSARLTSTDEALPRIPPLHGTLALELPIRGVTIAPEVTFAAKQDEVFRDESPTAGYVLLNVSGSYVLPGAHVVHVFSVRGYNLTNEEYRLHTSFIKDLAPEMGRGISFSYSMRFF